MNASFNPLAQEIDAMLEVSPNETGCSAVLTVDPALSVFKDHFPQQAILPGICMIQAVLLAAGRSMQRPPLELEGVKIAKMVHPVLPGDVVRIEVEYSQQDAGQWLLKARLSMQDQRVAELSLLARQTSGPQVV